MGKKKALRVIVPDRPLQTGTKELVEIHLRIPDEVEVINSAVTLEGRCRAAFSGHDSLHTICSESLYFPIQHYLSTSNKGDRVLPSGYHRIPVFLPLPVSLPGTFTAKFGAISYRILAKVTLKKNGEEAELENDKVVDIHGKVRLLRPALNQPISIDRHMKRKVLCFNLLDAQIKVEMDRSCFVVGEHLLVSGSVTNQHTTHVIKNISIELRQKVLYSSGDNKKVDDRLLTRLICGSASPGETFALHHSMQIPSDCYPSLFDHHNPIQVSYDLVLTSSGNFEMEIPVFLGTHKSSPSNRRSLTLPDWGEKSSIYYCIPPSSSDYSSYKDYPPPYSTNPMQSQPVFIPIHMLNTSYRPFMPMYGMNGIPPRDPPRYRDEPTFLKIEEIDD